MNEDSQNDLDTHEVGNKNKKRYPVLSLLLSFISVGLGQFYNGEFVKGILLKSIVCFSFILLVYYYFFEYFGQSFDLIFLLLFLSIYAALKLYSMVQAFIFSMRKGKQYQIKIWNKSYIYVLFFVLFLVVPIFFTVLIKNRSMADISDHHPFRSDKAKAEFLKYYEEKEKKWPVKSENRYVDTSFGKTYVKISGEKNKPNLVLLHGGGGNSLHFIPNVEELSKHYRTYAIDNIYDYGKSVFTKELKTKEDMIGWLDEVFQGLNLHEEINIIGLSYGGWVTSQYTLTYPSKIRKVVLVAPFSTIVPLTMEWVKKGILCFLPHRKYISDLYYWFVGNNTEIDEEMKKMIEGEIDMVYCAIRSFKPKGLVNPVAPLSDDELSKYKQETLFMIGENDVILSPKKAVERIIKHAPGITVEVIPDAGHDMTFVKSEVINRKIIEFLK